MSGASQPLGASPPSMPPSIAAGQDAASLPQMNVAELFTQWPMPLGQAASMPDASAASKGHPEASLPQVLHAIPEASLAPGDARDDAAMAEFPSGAFSPAAFSGCARYGGLLPGNAMPLDPAGVGAFPEVEPLACPGGPNLTAAATVTTDELKLERAFYKASGKSTFPPRSIGIGNVGKKGGNVTPGGVQVSLVALCNYILRHGGWEKVREPISSALSASVPSHT